MLRSSLVFNKNLLGVSKRYNSALIPSMVSYFKDKGTCVPGAKYVLSSDEYERYKLFRTIKLGKIDELSEIIKRDKYTNVSKDTLKSFTEDLQKQPYSIPNFLFSWWGIQYGATGIMIFVNHIKLFDTSGPFEQFMNTITSDNIEHLEHVSNMSVGISGSLAALGAFSVYHSVKLFYQEAKSPYYDYDGMLAFLNKSSLQTTVMDPITETATNIVKSLSTPSEPSQIPKFPPDLSDHPDLDFPASQPTDKDVQSTQTKS